MEIVASSNMIRKFRTIKEFALNMGTSKTSEANKEGNRGPSQIIIKIKDPFIKRYQIQTGRYILKCGNIGSLLFYTDNSMSGNEFCIYDKDKEYKFLYENQQDIRNYLSNILDNILNENIEGNQLEQNMEEQIQFKLDKNLPLSEFAEERRKLEEDMNKLGVRMPRS